LKALGKVIKAEFKKVKGLKRLVGGPEHERKEVLRSLESIMESSLDAMSPEDAKTFLTRKLRELGFGPEKNPSLSSALD